MTPRFNPNLFHPVTWWLLGLAMAVASTMSRNLLFLVAICLIAIALMAASSNQPAAKTQGPGLVFYLILAALVIASRVLFRLIFNTTDPTATPALILPALEISLGFGEPVQLLGTVSAIALLAAVVDGLRLSAIILSIGLAATLANPRKLLRSTPSVLYEIAASVSIAINLAPQIVKSLGRVKAARKLRPASRKSSYLLRNVIPVFEDAIESSMRLAASMSSRGFGQQQTPAVRLTTGALSLAAVIFLALGGFLITLIGIEFVYLLVAGLILIVFAIWVSAKNSMRTRLIVNSFSSKDLWIIVAAVGIVLVSGIWMAT